MQAGAESRVQVLGAESNRELPPRQHSLPIPGS